MPSTIIQNILSEIINEGITTLQIYPSLVILNVLFIIGFMDLAYHYSIKQRKILYNIQLTTKTKYQVLCYSLIFICLIVFGCGYYTMDLYSKYENLRGVIIGGYILVYLILLLCIKHIIGVGIITRKVIPYLIDTPVKYTIQKSDHPYLLMCIPIITNIPLRSLSKYNKTDILLITIEEPFVITIHNLSDDQYMSQLIDFYQSNTSTNNYHWCTYCDDYKQKSSFNYDNLVTTDDQYGKFCTDCTKDILKVAADKNQLSSEEVLSITV